MQSHICDPFQVKKLEKLLKRELKPEERDGEVPVKVKMPDGRWHIEWVRKFNFRDFYGK